MHQVEQKLFDCQSTSLANNAHATPYATRQQNKCFDQWSDVSLEKQTPTCPAIVPIIGDLPQVSLQGHDPARNDVNEKSQYDQAQCDIGAVHDAEPQCELLAEMQNHETRKRTTATCARKGSNAAAKARRPTGSPTTTVPTLWQYAG